MSIGAIINTAQRGMSEQLDQVKELAVDINQPNPDLVNNVVDLLASQNVFEANAAVVETADEMLDVILAL